MSILSDIEIKERVYSQNMISPYVEKLVKENINGERIISYGQSSYGYDIRCSNVFDIFTNINYTKINPKKFDDRNLIRHVSDDSILIPPNSFALTHSIETIKVPRDIIIVCIGKSTYARCGVVVNVTPLEPEWEGQITLELSNTTNLPLEIFVNEGIAQLLFFKADKTCLTSYKDRNGKYQNQIGIVNPKV